MNSTTTPKLQQHNICGIYCGVYYSPPPLPLSRSIIPASITHQYLSPNERTLVIDVPANPKQRCSNKLNLLLQQRLLHRWLWDLPISTDDNGFIQVGCRSCVSGREHDDFGRLVLVGWRSVRTLSVMWIGFRERGGGDIYRVGCGCEFHVEYFSVSVDADCDYGIVVLLVQSLL